MCIQPIRKARRHFRHSLKWRFKIPSIETQELEKSLMRELFMGNLNVVEDEERGLKIYYPAIHNRCILVFSKSANVFITGYKLSNHGKGRQLLNGRI